MGDVHSAITRIAENHEFECDSSRWRDGLHGLKLTFFGHIEALVEDHPLNLFRAQEMIKWKGYVW